MFMGRKCGYRAGTYHSGKRKIQEKTPLDKYQKYKKWNRMCRKAALTIKTACGIKTRERVWAMV